jgi:signal transduction histidine kinase
LPSANPTGDDIDRLGATVQEMSERIAEQLRLLEQTDVRRRELLANVSHDLRTPLASMQGYLETLLLKHGTLPPEEERSYLEVAAKHSERLGRLIRDLFQLTKLEAHELKPQCESFPIAELVQDVVEKFQLAADKRGLQLSSHLTGQHAQLHADIGMIESVLENLIENAMRHTPAGGVIHVEVVPLEKARVAVRVIDTGRGIPDDELPTIFDRYYRVDRGEASDAGSTGLGLAITRHIVDLHGGKISVESVLNKGTTFSIELPLHADSKATPSAGVALL